MFTAFMYFNSGRTKVETHLYDWGATSTGARVNSQYHGDRTA